MAANATLFLTVTDKMVAKPQLGKVKREFKGSVLAIRETSQNRPLYSTGGNPHSANFMVEVKVKTSKELQEITDALKKIARDDRVSYYVTEKSGIKPPV
ncbi:MAG: hypothetical protein KGH71_01925 [Candidatus Micrarchaeota archaeon]|nr:hypothetical protein [Candidatus Micrarchaeota archaeon]